MKQELLAGVDGTLSFTPYIDNRPAIATSATVSVYNPSEEVFVEDESASIDATTGVISYTLSSDYTDTLYENCIVQWSYVVATVTYYRTALFDIVLNQLVITITDDDLYKYQSDILRSNVSHSGLTASATNTTLVDGSLSLFADNAFNGGQIQVIHPTTGAIQNRTVTDFVSSTGTVTVSPAWTVNPDSTYNYIIRKGFSDKVAIAFEEIKYELSSRGFRPALIMESSALRIPHIKLTLSIICGDFSTEPEDKWDRMATRYKSEYLDAMSKLKVQYDSDEDGIISGLEKDADTGQIRLRR